MTWYRKPAMVVSMLWNQTKASENTPMMTRHGTMLAKVELRTSGTLGGSLMRPKLRSVMNRYASTVKIETIIAGIRPLPPI